MECRRPACAVHFSAKSPEYADRFTPDTGKRL
jgi:hypothetical protein